MVVEVYALFFVDAKLVFITREEISDNLVTVEFIYICILSSELLVFPEYEGRYCE